MAKGPVVVMTVSRGGSANMGSNLMQLFVYSILVSFVSAVAPVGKKIGS